MYNTSQIGIHLSPYIFVVLESESDSLSVTIGQKEPNKPKNWILLCYVAAIDFLLIAT